MRRPLSRLLSFCLLALALTGRAAEPLRVGGIIVAPLVVGEAGAPLRGALRDYLEREVVPRGVPLQWLPPTSVHAALADLRSGRLDILLLASGAGARQPGTAPFPWTYLRTQPHLAVLETSPLHDVAALTQLAGLDIGWLAGPPLSAGLLQSGAQWHRIDAIDWQMAALRQLRAGQLDGVYFENEYSPRWYAGAAHVPIRLVRLPMPPRSFFMLYSLKADRAAVGTFDRVAGAAFAGHGFRDFLRDYGKGDPAAQ